MCRCQGPCRQFRAPSSPPETQHFHPNTSISSPSGAVHKDLLRDFARDAAQQGGVKPAGMFHIHTQREYIISPSGQCVLSRGLRVCWITFAWSWCFATWRSLKKPWKLSSFFQLCGAVTWSSWQMLDSVKAANLGLQVCRADDDLWLSPLSSPLIPIRPAYATGCVAEMCWGEGCSRHITSLLLLPWLNNRRIKMSHG